MTNFFINGEMIVLTLKDGRHYLGEYYGSDTVGVNINVDAKTEMRLAKAKNTKFENLIKKMVDEELKSIISPADWVDKARKISGGKQLFDNIDLDILKKHVIGSLYEFHRENVGRLWTGPKEEPDVTKPYLRQLKRSVRTLVPWDRIDEVCSATELGEKAEIADLSNLIDNGEFHRLIESMNEGETND